MTESTVNPTAQSSAHDRALDAGLPPLDTSALTATPSGRLRRNVLTLPDTLAQSVTVMAPAMSGGFITYLAAIKAGGATPLAYLLAAIACLLIGGVVAEFALSLHTAGSLYTYTVHGLGSFWGYVMGWGYTFGLWLAGPSVLAGSGVFMSLVMTDIGAPSLLCQWWLWFGLGLVGWYVIAVTGVQLSTRSSLVFTVFGMTVLLVLALIVIFKGGQHGNTIKAFDPQHAGVGWTGIFGGVAFGILSFTGFETSASLAEETKHPRRNVPLAVIGAVGIGGLFYVIVTYATSVGYGVKEATSAWPASASGLAPLADKYASPMTDLVLLAVAFDAFFCGLALSNAVTRTILQMGREGVLPHSLAVTHSKHQTPHRAMTLYLIGSVLFSVLLVALTTQATRNALGGGAGHLAAGFYIFGEGLTIITPPIMLGYGLMSIGGIVYALRHHRIRLLIASIGGLVVSGVAVYGSLYYSFVEAAPGAGIPTPYAVIPWVILGWLVIGALIAAWLKTSHQHRWARVGTVFE